MPTTNAVKRRALATVRPTAVETTVVAVVVVEIAVGSVVGDFGSDARKLQREVSARAFHA